MTLAGRTEAKAVFCYVCGDQGRRLEDRNRLDTVLVPAVNDADWLGGYMPCGCEKSVSMWALGIVCSQG